MKEKENITVYVPKTLDQAKLLFDKFKRMNLNSLDEEKFFFLYDKGNGEIGFCIRNGTWQVCDPNCDLFNVTLAEI